MSNGKRWAQGYQVAWEADDPDAAAALYAPDCIFRSAPFREPEPPIEYTRRVFPEAKVRDVHFGEPVEEGDRAAVEWWTTLVMPNGEEHKLAGCSMLRFGDDGLVVESQGHYDQGEYDRQLERGAPEPG